MSDTDEPMVPLKIYTHLKWRLRRRRRRSEHWYAERARWRDEWRQWNEQHGVLSEEHRLAECLRWCQKMMADSESGNERLREIANDAQAHGHTDIYERAQALLSDALANDR